MKKWIQIKRLDSYDYQKYFAISGTYSICQEAVGFEQGQKIKRAI